MPNVANSLDIGFDETADFLGIGGGACIGGGGGGGGVILTSNEPMCIVPPGTPLNCVVLSTADPTCSRAWGAIRIGAGKGRTAGFDAPVFSASGLLTTFVESDGIGPERFFGTATASKGGLMDATVPSGSVSFCRLNGSILIGVLNALAACEAGWRGWTGSWAATLGESDCVGPERVSGADAAASGEFMEVALPSGSTSLGLPDGSMVVGVPIALVVWKAGWRGWAGDWAAISGLL